MSALISRCRRSLGVLVLTVAALAAAPGTAGAADTVVAPGAVALRMTALDGHVVWIAGGGRQLMQRGPDGTVAPVAGAPAASYRSIDLGHSAAGQLVLTYLSCTSSKRCQAWADDLHGHRTALKVIIPKRCQLTSAPSLWDNRVAYGLLCYTLRGPLGMPDPRRSGLFVRKGTGAPKSVGLPAGDDPSDAEAPGWVDLRETRVAASTSGLNSQGAYVQTVNGTQRRLTSRSWDEGTEPLPLAGVSLSTDGVLWTLHEFVREDDPSLAQVIRLGPRCEEVERLTQAPGPEQHVIPARSIAVDGDTVYLYVPGTGIVTHDFVPTYTCPTPGPSAVRTGTSVAGNAVLVASAVAPRMTALDGVVVWITGSGASTRLIQRTAGGIVRPVKGAPAGSYRSIDLGRRAKGKLVLTYLRCVAGRCRAWADELHGHRTQLKHLAATRCALTAAPAVWNDRVAYAVTCSKLHGKAGVRDVARSGLFVREGTGAAKHAGLTARTQKDDRRADTGLWVDLRGTHVAGSTSGVDFLGAYTQSLDGKNLRYTGYARTEGVGQFRLGGLSLGDRGLLWSLYNHDQDGAPETLVNRLGRSCEDPGSDDHQPLMNPARPTGYAAESMAVDGSTVYLYVPGTGIVTHRYVPIETCA